MDISHDNDWLLHLDDVRLLFYCDENTGVVLSGSQAMQTGGRVQQGANAMFKFTDGNIKAKILTTTDASASLDANGTVNENQTFNFNPQSSRFIRNVFNTTPHNTNTHEPFRKQDPRGQAHVTVTV